VIKAVLFDMDGVLVDAKEWHFNALNQALGLFGYRIDRYDHLVTYDGLPTKRKLKMLSLDAALPESLHGFINDLKQNYTTEQIFKSCRPEFHIQYALSRLKQKGYKLAVCSNSIRPTVALMMQRLELADYLDLQMSNQDVKKAKPDPEIYSTAMKKLGVKPCESVVVEDNQHGIESGRASGAHVFEVRNSSQVRLENILAFIDNLPEASCSQKKVG